MSTGRLFLAVVACLLTLVAAENLGTPRNAGPDEPSHIIRGAGLVRGQLFGDRVSGPGVVVGAADIANADVANNDAIRSFDVPQWIAQPSEVCFAHDGQLPASCAQVEPTTGSGLVSTASSYPIWTHVLPGLATLVVGKPSALWLARFLHGLVPVLLLGWSITRLLTQRRGAGVSAVLVATTPMVLFLVAVVNPSGVVAAGAIALWVAGDELYRTGSARTWLLPAAFAALVLPRDDGLLWAALTFGLLAAVWRVGPVRTWAMLPTSYRIAMGATTAVGAAWAIVFRGGLVPVARPATGVEFAQIVVERTGQHIREAIGVLGWLDTQLPESMYALWCFSAGLVFMITLVTRANRRAVASASALGLFIVVGWLLEIVQGRTAGLFWQGRYALPMLAGFVLIAGLTDGADARVGPAGARVPGVLALVVLNVSFLQALRRWGVGASGSIRPWAWDTWGAPLPVVVLIAAHLTASAALAWLCWTVPSRPPAHATATEPLTAGAGAQARSRW